MDDVNAHVMKSILSVQIHSDLRIGNLQLLRTNVSSLRLGKIHLPLVAN